MGGSWLLFVAWLTLSPAALAAPLSETSSKLRWKIHRTVGHQEKAPSNSRSASAGGSAQARRQWMPSSRGNSAAHRPAPRRTPSMVIQASADSADPFSDPFEDGGMGKRSIDAPMHTTSQPTTPGEAPPSEDPFPTIDAAPDPSTDNPFPDDPAQMPENLRDRIREYDPQLMPFEETLPENESVVPGLAPSEDEGCDDYKRECARAVESLRNRDITKIIFGIVIEGTDGKPPVEGVDYPCECLLGRDLETARFTGRNWAPTTFTWTATGTCFKPLYFQDVQLERYGHSWNPVVQPFMSAAHFFVSVPLLPYKMGLRNPHECVYTLGYYRPGSCAPYFIEPIPLSLRGAAYEALGATAFAFWFWPPPTGP